jgi:hypothetical protein
MMEPFYNKYIASAITVFGMFRNKNEDIRLQNLLYIEEIAATVDLISAPDATDIEIEHALDDLMRKVGVNIADCFKTIPHKDLRYAFIMSDQEELVMLRVGKQMSLTEDDAKITDWVLANFDQTHILEIIPEGMVPGSNIEAVGLVRNAGASFQFGFVILIPDKSALTRSAVQSFYATSSSVPLILYIDKLMNYVVKYSMKLKGGRG